MALPVKDQLRYWGFAAAVFALILWALGDVLLPFVIGGAIAYFLDPVADRLERLGLSRMAATAIITVVGVLGFVLAILMVVPALITQLLDLVDVLPALFKELRGFIERQFPSLLDRESSTHQMLVSFGDTLKSKTGDVLQTVLTSLGSAINIVVLLVIVPVVAVYMLLDWDRMIARIGELLPRDHAPTIKRLAVEIDAVLASFVRGMGTVCLILGTYYAVALMLAGLQFGLIVGFIAGLVTFIPYLGALIGGTLAIGLALFQFWGDWAHIGLIAGIFAIGQVTEGNFLTPKLVGNSVGLHPVWLLLALSVFGALFGFVGMLIAVPVAAALGVLARFATSLYLDSRLYTGLESQDQETE
ncbi:MULTISPECIES: AI-2E family transporter [unclassified Ruegeria]|uniref:AI-2E family transporter n=1 Tax=unclassified Ruegeria TaxID=2625375 RepID=UPI0014894B3B|nr:MULTISPECIES: AI-2E family transporter [unclassified Ruegeria]NOD34668.1 AI-2E family transporter [Ruegeria sp. HKCCD7296]NOD48284.1 AI-2E family transporter [Ruegeria sp. HKCCD5849]NOD52304.1 AI-2E family transporter [Ruegeria sp. HKCCD5851]NOD68407.1 AI-2E family transporter [Ruegeria sp. HKCCD7303]NOE34786.1 AI-2E family transporter [Ruegeria sp. HKCCD7318]